MKKKEYKQPTIKVVELGDRIMIDIPQGSGFTPADAKCGTFNSDNDFDTEW